MNASGTSASQATSAMAVATTIHVHAPRIASLRGYRRSGVRFVLMIVIVMVIIIVMMMTVLVAGRMVVVMLRLVQALPRPRAARILAEHQRLDRHRHGVGRHADAAEIDIVEVP